MTNDELRAAGQLMIDVADGKVKEVEVLPHRRDRGPWILCTLPAWDWLGNDYRAAPEPQYRPYTRAEMLDLVGKRVERKCGGSRCLVLGFHAGKNFAYCDVLEDTGLGGERLPCSSEDLLAGWTHIDGSPCGVEVEDDE